jgi:hypothetical protein
MDHDPFGAFSKATASAEQRRIEILANADLDGDGELSNEEFESALAKGGLDPNSEEFRAAIDGDGVHDIFKGRSISLTRTTDGKNRFARSKANRCTDFIGLVLFILCWLVMIVIMVFAREKGDLYSLYKGRDKAGDYCGINNKDKSWATEEGGKDNSKEPFIFYPGMDTADGFMIIESISKLTEVNVLNIDPRKLGGICVEECPSGEDKLPGDPTGRLVNNDYAPLFGRCLPKTPEFTDVVLCTEEDSRSKCSVRTPLELNATCEREQPDYQLTGILNISGFANISISDARRYEKAFQRALVGWMVMYDVGPDKSIDYEQVIVDNKKMLQSFVQSGMASGKFLPGESFLVIEFSIDGILDFTTHAPTGLRLLYEQVKKAMVGLEEPQTRFIFAQIFALALVEEGVNIQYLLGDVSVTSFQVLSQTYGLQSCSKGNDWAVVERPGNRTTVSRADIRKAALEWKRPGCCSTDGRFQPLLCQEAVEGGKGKAGTGGPFGLTLQTRENRLNKCTTRLSRDCTGTEWTADGNSWISKPWVCKDYEVTDATFQSPLTWQSSPLQEQFTTIVKLIGFTIADCIASFELVM